MLAEILEKVLVEILPPYLKRAESPDVKDDVGLFRDPPPRAGLTLTAQLSLRRTYVW
jgi:hypothetical protein